MLGHNDDEYIKMVRIMDRMKIFLGCYGLINNALSYHDHYAMNQTVDRKGTMDTKTVNPTPNNIEMETSEHSEI